MRCLASVLILGALFAARAGEAPGAFHKNPAWGYKVKVPKDWRHATVGTNELWIASKHLGKRELEAVKNMTWARELPEMWVVGFPHARKQAGAHYDGYEDFIRAQSDWLEWSSGYEFTRKKEATIDGVKVTQYEIGAKAERGGTAPRRIVAWVYHFDDIDFAVQFKILDEHYDGYAATFRACMKSFRRIKRTKALPGTARSEATVDARELDKLSAEERERRLKDAVDARFRGEIERLQEGWKHSRSRHYLVLSNAPQKFVRGTVTHAETMHSHFDKLFGAKKAGHVPPGILRIFASDGERAAYAKGAGQDGLIREVLVVFGHGWEKDDEYEGLNATILSAWFHARHPLLEETVPGWLAIALKKYTDMLRSKGKRVVYTHGDYDRDTIRFAIKKGEFVPVVDLITRGLKGGGGERELPYDQLELQQRSFGFWLMTKAKGKYRSLVRDYLAALLGAILREEQAHLAIAAKEAKGEGKEKDPDAASDRERARGEVKEKVPEIRQAAFDAVFGKWSQKEWDRLTGAWLSAAK